MNSDGNTNTKDTKSNVDHKSQGKRDTNNNTAFYRKLKMNHDLKYKKNYPQFFSRPPYLYGVTSKSKSLVTSKVQHPTGVKSNRCIHKKNLAPTQSPSESKMKAKDGEKIKNTSSKTTAIEPKKVLSPPQKKITTTKPTKDITLSRSMLEPSKPPPPALNPKNSKPSLKTNKVSPRAQVKKRLQVEPHSTKVDARKSKGFQNVSPKPPTKPSMVPKLVGATKVAKHSTAKKDDGIKRRSNAETATTRTSLIAETSKKKSNTAQMKQALALETSASNHQEPTRTSHAPQKRAAIVANKRKVSSDKRAAKKQKRTTNQNLNPTRSNPNPLTNFQIGSIVSAQGHLVDPTSFPNAKNSPTLYGVVHNSGWYDDKTLDPKTDQQTCVKFVMNGERKWLDTTELNTHLTTIEDQFLTFVEGPPVPFTTDVEVVGEHRKWFMECEMGDEKIWGVIPYPDSCEGCGSPWCLYKKRSNELDNIIERHLPADSETNHNKRFACYRDAIRMIGKGRTMGWKNRLRLGWCYENRVQNKFPSEKYTGYRPITKDDPCTSDSDDDSVIDLSK